ncbi:MAG: hypothetical protein M3Q60_06295 [Actinomycetota bacterium]|nr:hypothetical protein [Actinomycetota bacterium]
MALCAIRAEVRPLDHVRWHLWWAGYEVPVEHVREFLSGSAAEADEHIRKVVDPGTGSLSEAAWEVLEAASTGRLSKPLSGSRKRVGKKRFDTFMRIMLEAIAGQFEGFSYEPTENPREDEQRIMEKGLGLERAYADRVGHEGPWLRNSLEGYLKGIGRLVDGEILERRLAAITDEQLLEARDEARSWLALLGGYGLMFDGLLGKGAFGISGISEALRDMGAREQALFTAVWAISRFRGPADVREGLKVHGKPTPEMEEGLAAWTSLQEARKTSPALSNLLSPRRVKAAWRDLRETERLAKELDEVGRREAKKE